MIDQNIKHFEGEGYMVFDDVFTPEEQHNIWTYIQEERFEQVHAKRWVKAFRLSDGCPMWGPPYLSEVYEPDTVHTVYPSSKAIDLVIQKVHSLTPFCEKFIGKHKEDWAYFFARAYLYPAGTGLSWHRDNENNVSGAFVYYAHPFWHPQWGGEFLIAPLNTQKAVFPQTKTFTGEEKFLGAHLDDSHEVDILMEEGRGSYIMPKPNRLMFMTSGVLHEIKKVDASAGNKVRASIQGFFQDPKGIVKKG